MFLCYQNHVETELPEYKQNIRESNNDDNNNNNNNNNNQTMPLQTFLHISMCVATPHVLQMFGRHVSVNTNTKTSNAFNFMFPCTSAILSIMCIA